MADSFLFNINPKFPIWFAKQVGETQIAVRNKWTELQGDPDIVQTHHSADHAKKYELLTFCKDTYGYDFS